MKKLEAKFFETNNDESEYINELKAEPLLESFDINNDNYIEFANALRDWKNCQGCNGLDECKNNPKGYLKNVILANDRYYFNTKACSFMQEYENKLSQKTCLNTLYISKNVLKSSLSDFHLTSEARTKAYNYILKFIDSYKDNNHLTQGLCLTGPCGCGKTYLLAALANELAKINVESLLIYVPDLIRDLKSAVGTPRLEEMMNMLKEVPVLMLDDLGSEMMSPWVRDEIISPLLNFRMMDEKPVFISTNLSMSSLTNHFASTNVDEDKTKATRIMTRLQRLVLVVKFNY